MPQPRKKSAYRTTKHSTKSYSIIDKNENCVLDQSTICSEWNRLWSSFGFSEHQWSSRASKVGEYTRKLFENKLSNYTEQLNKRKTLLKQSIDDYEDLILRTGLPSQIDKSFLDEFKLKEQETYIEKKMQDLLINQGQLIQKRNELENIQKELCFLLNSSPIEFDENIPLSLKEINNKIQDHIKMLNDLKDLRLNQISSYFIKLKEYSQQLEWKPLPSSIIQNLLNEEFDHCLTVDCLNEIESTIQRLQIEIEEQKTRFSILHDQLKHLYERLNKNPKKDYCLAYKIGSENINVSTIKQLEDEISNCRNERMKNGEEYRNSIQQQIINLLEKSHLGDDERIIFNKLNSESLSSDLLDAYDVEYERIYQLYEKRKSIVDAYDKWFSFWNNFVSFTKSSTDPGRFHIRGYNAEAEGRKRKKFHRELPIIEQEFLNVLSEHNDSIFLIDNTPIRQKFDEAHHQVPSSALPSSTKATFPTTTTNLTPVRSRTPAATPRRIVNKEVDGLSTVRRLAKTPANTNGRKLLNKVASKTDCQQKRSKPRPAPPASPKQPVPVLPVHPPARTDDQALDFSLLHTMKNIHGQTKVMTSTPNSSFDLIENRNGKTAHNTISRRKSKRISKRAHIPIITIQNATEETVVCL